MLQGLQQHVLSWRINKKVFSSSRISFPSCSCCVRVAHRWMYCIVYSVLQRSQKSCEPSSLVSLSRIFLTLREKAWFVRWSECGVQLNAYVAETEVIKCYGFFFFFYDQMKDPKSLFPQCPSCVSCVCVCLWAGLQLPGLAWSHLNFPEGKRGSCCSCLTRPFLK